MGGNRRQRFAVSAPMQPASWSRKVARFGTSWLVVAIVALAGCSSAPPLPVPGTGPLVTVQSRGGMCMDGGMCESLVVLERDGRVHDGGSPQKTHGRVSPAAYAALDAAIQSADYARMKSRPFTGECPIAFDGQELIFEFAVAGGTQRLASCEIDIDWGSPLFIALAGALGEWISIPFEIISGGESPPPIRAATRGRSAAATPPFAA